MLEQNNHKVFESGLKKESIKKRDYTLIPVEILDILADRFQFGADKYGRDNWKNGTKEDAIIFQEAAYRHLLQWINKLNKEEDHAAALMTDVAMYEWLTKYKKDERKRI